MTAMSAIPKLLVVVIRSDDVPDVDRGFRAKVDELEPRVIVTGGTGPGVHVNADVFLRFVDRKVVNLVVFAVVLLRLHHEAAAGQLAEHACLAPFGIEDQHLRFVVNVDAFESALLLYAFAFRRVFTHFTSSPNALTGSMSTGTSLILAKADFSSAGIVPYLWNHRSARLRSPVASISSSSLARPAMATGIFA